MKYVIMSKDQNYESYDNCECCCFKNDMFAGTCEKPNFVSDCSDDQCIYVLEGVSDEQED